MIVIRPKNYRPPGAPPRPAEIDPPGQEAAPEPVLEPVADPARAALEDSLIKLLGDRYEVVRLIALGGMASIYQVRHRGHGGLFVAKVLHPELAARPEVVAAFHSEAAMLAQLAGHPGIVPIHDLLAAGDLHAMILAFVEGEDLDQLLQRRGHFGHDEALTLLSQIAHILLHLEHAGVVHGDVSPGNIRLDLFGQYKLLDFGIARRPGRQEGVPPLPAAGTPAYNSPEQLRNEPLDARTDLYSLGMVFAECLLGHPLLAAPTLAELRDKHLKPDWSLPPEIEADALLKCILHSLLQADRDKRMPSATELVATLTAARFDPGQIAPTPLGTPLQPPRPRRKRLELAAS